MTPAIAYYAMPYVSIVGSAGYTGQETLDRVLASPRARALRGRLRFARRPGATALDPRLNRNGGKRVPRLITNDAALACEADITFLCLSHEEAAAFEPPSRGVVVDLSGAHRLTRPGGYEEWYGFTHPRPDELGGWSYGLPELSPPEGRLIANPGCYATAVLLALGPLADAIDPECVVVDAMSGMTGAGTLAAAVDARRVRARERLAVQGRGRTSTSPRSPSCSASRSRSRPTSCPSAEG